MTQVNVTFDIADEPRLHYTQGDIVKGVAHLTVPLGNGKDGRPDKDTKPLTFENIKIDFTGVSTNSWMQPGSGHHVADTRVTSTHNFLNIEGPDLSRQYPPDKVLEAGRTYDFEFQFRIPEKIPEESCRPDVQSEKLRQLHQELPPTLGDAKGGGLGMFLKNQSDMASPFECVNYHVRVEVWSKAPGASLPMRPGFGQRRVRVIPATDEQPPLHISDNDLEYKKQDEIKLHHHLMKTGSLSVEAIQPRPFRLPAPNAKLDPEARVNTSVEVMIRFDPKKSGQAPPELSRINRKLEVINYVSAGARKDFPSKKKMEATPFKLSIWDEKLDMSDLQLENVTWAKHAPGATKEDVEAHYRKVLNGYSTWCPSPSQKHLTNLPFYTARVYVPLTLPTDKLFVPTFHSSMNSRIYVAHLKLTTPWCVLMKPHLRIPVQVVAERSRNQRSTALPSETGNDMDEWLQAPVTGEVPLRVDHVDKDALAAHTVLPPYSPAEESGPASPEYEESPSSGPASPGPAARTEFPLRTGQAAIPNMSFDPPPNYQGFGPFPAYGVAH